MQKLLNISVLCLLLWSCGKSDPPAPTEDVNVVPTVPELVYPSNNLLCINNVLDFQWNASSDGNGDVITYLIEISKDNQFTEITHMVTGSKTTQNITLERGFAYYWRVKATDSKNASSDYSTTFNLYTQNEAISNHLPFVPEVVKPLMNATENEGTTTLEWTGSDTDGDPLVFDIYFGTDNPPETLISENQNVTSINVTTVAATDYFWKVVVKDDKGGQTIGQIWNFRTN